MGNGRFCKPFRQKTFLSSSANVLYEHEVFPNKLQLYRLFSSLRFINLFFIIGDLSAITIYYHSQGIMGAL